MHRLTTAEELLTIGFPLQITDRVTLDCDNVCKPILRIIMRVAAPRGEQRVAIGENFGLHKQI